MTSDTTGFSLMSAETAERWAAPLEKLTIATVWGLAVVTGFATTLPLLALTGTAIGAGMLYYAVSKAAGEPSGRVASLAALTVGVCDPSEGSVLALLATACIVIGLQRDRVWWLMVGGAMAVVGASASASAGVILPGLIAGLVATRHQRSWPRQKRMLAAGGVCVIGWIVMMIVMPRSMHDGLWWPTVAAVVPLGVRLIAGFDGRRDGAMTLVEGSKQIIVDPYGPLRQTLFWMAGVALGATAVVALLGAVPTPGLVGSASLLLGLTFRRKRRILQGLTLLPAAVAAVVLAWLG